MATPTNTVPTAIDGFCLSKSYRSRFANNALLDSRVRIRVWIREQRKIKDDQRHY